MSGTEGGMAVVSTSHECHSAVTTPPPAPPAPPLAPAPPAPPTPLAEVFELVESSPPCPLPELLWAEPLLEDPVIPELASAQLNGSAKSAAMDAAPRKTVRLGERP